VTRAQVSDFHSGSARVSLALLFLRGKNEGLFDPEILGLTGLKHMNESYVEPREGGGGVLPKIGKKGMCRGEGYGFQAVYSRIGYINQSVWV